MYKFDVRSLSTRMVLSFIGLVILTAMAAGLPAVWLISRQLNRQAWAQVQQGSRATQALYHAQSQELANLAMLTAQRPTLQQLLTDNDQTALVAYLRTLQPSEAVDALVICNAAGEVVSLAGIPRGARLCASGDSGPFQVFTGNGSPTEVWHVAAYPLVRPELPQPDRVLVARLLNDSFAQEMRAKTGLEHVVRVNNQPVAASLNNYSDIVTAPPDHSPNGSWQLNFSLDSVPYFAVGFLLSDSPTAADDRVTAESALQVANITASQQELVLTTIASLIIIAALGSVVGALLARQINRPLAQLAQATSVAGSGNLSTPVTINSGVREVDMVAQALEQARVDLRQSLAAVQQEKAWTDHLLDSIVEGVVTLDDQCRITFFSRGAERITGLSRDEVLRRHCNQVFPLVEPGAAFNQCIPASGQQAKVVVNLPPGSQTSLAITGARLRPPNTEDVAVALVFRDVSKEEAVHRLIGHFLANVSHEFRTPLSSLAASIELLLDEAPSLSGAELQHLLMALHLSTLSLHTLVDNLLEGASIEAGHFRVHVQTTNLTKIIAEAIRTIQPLLDKRDQLLVLELPTTLPPIRADFRRTVQVLVNLLSNASKYGPTQAEITVSARVADGLVRVAVADQGPGIAPEHKDDLFRKFVYPNLPGGKTQYGAGLGLLVVKAVVDAQGGQVGVEDRPDGGSIFWFTLVTEREK